MKVATPHDCPCGSGSAYARCCYPFHAGAPAPTAEALMRSRYCAYVLRLEDYLRATWHANTRPMSLVWEDAPTWLGLQVKRHEIIDANNAIVEFVARFRSGGVRAQRLHEVSRFLFEEGRWYYVDGEFPSAG